jgi:hypothetical protein
MDTSRTRSPRCLGLDDLLSCVTHAPTRTLGADETELAPPAAASAFAERASHLEGELRTGFLGLDEGTDARPHLFGVVAQIDHHLALAKTDARDTVEREKFWGQSSLPLREVAGVHFDQRTTGAVGSLRRLPHATRSTSSAARTSER